MIKNTALKELENEAYEFEIVMDNNEASVGSALKWGKSVGKLTVARWLPGQETSTSRGISPELARAPRDLASFPQTGRRVCPDVIRGSIPTLPGPRQQLLPDKSFRKVEYRP